MVECRAWGPVMHVNSDKGYTYGILAETVYSTLVMQIAIMERFGCALKLSVSAFAFALHHINELRLKKKRDADLGLSGWLIGASTPPPPPQQRRGTAYSHGA